MDTVAISRFLSFVLRHRPASIGLGLDDNGWADLDELIRLANAHGHALDRAIVAAVVADNDKQRFTLDASANRIRANQGHSIKIELDLAPLTPPPLLYHGTASRFVDSIRAQGLHKGQRHHVHLSEQEATAIQVGQRHGRPIVLVVQAGEMSRAGHRFFRSDNGVWLTDNVPAGFIHFPG
jgi:putative RNA 2'-phosphotransferase